MNKADLVNAIAHETDLSKEKADAALSSMIEQITNALARNESISLVGFGSFTQSHRSARTGRNPKTGEDIQIAASNSVNFKAGKALKESVNQK